MYLISPIAHHITIWKQNQLSSITEYHPTLSHISLGFYTIAVWVSSLLLLFIERLFTVDVKMLLRTERNASCGKNDLCKPGYCFFVDNAMLLDGPWICFAKNVSTVFLYIYYYNYISIHSSFFDKFKFAFPQNFLYTSVHWPQTELFMFFSCNCIGRSQNIDSMNLQQSHLFS